MRRKYCDYYYSIKKTDKGLIWKIMNKDGEVLQSSTDNEDDDDKYFPNETAARSDAIDAIQDYYR